MPPRGGGASTLARTTAIKEVKVEVEVEVEVEAEVEVEVEVDAEIGTEVGVEVAAQALLQEPLAAGELHVQVEVGVVKASGLSRNFFSKKK